MRSSYAHSENPSSLMRLQSLRDFFQGPVLRLKAEGQEFPRVLLLGEILAKLVDRVFLFARSHLIRAQVICSRTWCGVCHWEDWKGVKLPRGVCSRRRQTSKAQPRVKEASGGDAQVREPGGASALSVNRPVGRSEPLAPSPRERP